PRRLAMVHLALEGRTTMSFLLFADSVPPPSASRRNALVLSGAAIALLAGREALAQGAAAKPEDLQILNTALGAEHEAVAAYQVGAESGLLQKPALDVAVKFQGHHKQHIDVLAKTVEKL